MRNKLFFALAATAALTLSACGGASSGEANNDAKDPGETGYDVSHIEADAEVTALVPESLKKADILRNGASTDYAPGEYRKEDGKTPTGYDIDLARAIAKTMGLSDAETSHSAFDSLIPKIGSTFDVGLSSFSITAEREKATNMISYVQVGSQFAVAKGNPNKFDPADPCGAVIGVQTGTYQFDYVKELSNKCTSEGKKAIQVKPHERQTDIAPKVIGKQYDATLADSTVIGFAVTKTNGQLEKIGDIIDAAPQGIVVSKDNPELAEAVKLAVQKLMDSGELKKILGHYGAQDAALETAELNPLVK